VIHSGVGPLLDWSLSSIIASSEIANSEGQELALYDGWCPAAEQGAATSMAWSFAMSRAGGLTFGEHS